MKIVVITLVFLAVAAQRLQRAKDFSASRAVLHRSWEGTEPGQLTQTGQRGVPHYTASCSVINWGKGGGRG